MPVIKTKDLPNIVKSALKSIKFNKGDIYLNATDTISFGGGASDGYRAVLIVIDLASEKIVRTLHGSWGGRNMFVNTIDDAPEPVSIPDNFLVILGAEGGYGTYASLYANTKTVAPLLPASSIELSPVQKRALTIFGSIKGGQYRTDELKSAKVTKSDVLHLLACGLLKSDKAGRIQITTEGKNAS